MIYCLSCEKYPKDTKVIPNGSTFPIDTFKVKLISNELPSTMPRTGADVEGLANDAKFSVGSLLYVVSGNDDSEVYVFVDNSVKAYEAEPDALKEFFRQAGQAVDTSHLTDSVTMLTKEGFELRHEVFLHEAPTEPEEVEDTTE